MRQASKPGVFISYSQNDEIEKEKLLTHLKVLDDVEVWSDDKIGAGQDREQAIGQAIDQARVAVLLITANYLASDFIEAQQVARLLEDHRQGRLVVFPVVARACAWRQVAWLKKLQVRPKNGAPVWRENGVHVDETLAEIVKEVADVIAESQISTSPAHEDLPFDAPAACLRMTLQDQSYCYPLKKRVTAIGRAKSCQVEIPDECDNVARLQATIFYEEGHFVIADGNKEKPTKFGTFINGTRVQPQATLRLKAGDQIVLGGFRVQERGELARGACEIIFELRR